jgi:hypothetical protein
MAVAMTMGLRWADGRDSSSLSRVASRVRAGQEIYLQENDAMPTSVLIDD